ncbi:hypothetical protein [Caulobacter endophyticus]|uniref:hypothetical protein n=1 Tax=Caulobacter endophyticus TaxID=2172652 RepID=UPI0024106723|nr:hypothetical protein [Caulobacter endophyticus]MDG2530967.1 hypothetical protein [Caulobacter endophyticus]
MTLDQALAKLAADGVAERFYQVGGACGHDTIRIAREGEAWTVSYCERGQGDELVRTGDEAQAVGVFLAEVIRAWDFWRTHQPSGAAAP